MLSSKEFNAHKNEVPPQRELRGHLWGGANFSITFSNSQVKALAKNRYGEDSEMTSPAKLIDWFSSATRTGSTKFRGLWALLVTIDKFRDPAIVS